MNCRLKQNHGKSLIILVEHRVCLEVNCRMRTQFRNDDFLYQGFNLILLSAVNFVIDDHRFSYSKNYASVTPSFEGSGMDM